MERTAQDKSRCLLSGRMEKKQDIGNSAPSLNTGSRGERCKGLVNVMLAHVLKFLTTGNKISSLEMKKRKKHN